MVVKERSSKSSSRDELVEYEKESRKGSRKATESLLEDILQSLTEDKSVNTKGSKKSKKSSTTKTSKKSSTTNKTSKSHRSNGSIDTKKFKTKYDSDGEEEIVVKKSKKKKSSKSSGDENVAEKNLESILLSEEDVDDDKSRKSSTSKSSKKSKTSGSKKSSSRKNKDKENSETVVSLQDVADEDAISASSKKSKSSRRSKGSKSSRKNKSSKEERDQSDAVDAIESEREIVETREASEEPRVPRTIEGLPTGDEAIALSHKVYTTNSVCSSVESDIRYKVEPGQSYDDSDVCCTRLPNFCKGIVSDGTFSIDDGSAERYTTYDEGFYHSITSSFRRQQREKEMSKQLEKEVIEEHKKKMDTKSQPETLSTPITKMESVKEEVKEVKEVQEVKQTEPTATEKVQEKSLDVALETLPKAQENTVDLSLADENSKRSLTSKEPSIVREGSVNDILSDTNSIISRAGSTKSVGFKESNEMVEVSDENIITSFLVNNVTKEVQPIDSTAVNLEPEAEDTEKEITLSEEVDAEPEKDETVEAIAESDKTGQTKAKRKGVISRIFRSKKSTGKQETQTEATAVDTTKSSGKKKGFLKSILKKKSSFSKKDAAVTSAAEVVKGAETSTVKNNSSNLVSKNNPEVKDEVANEIVTEITDEINSPKEEDTQTKEEETVTLQENETIKSEENKEGIDQVLTDDGLEKTEGENDRELISLDSIGDSLGTFFGAAGDKLYEAYMGMAKDEKTTTN